MLPSITSSVSGAMAESACAPSPLITACISAAVTSITSSQFVFKYCAVPLLLYFRKIPLIPSKYLRWRTKSITISEHTQTHDRARVKQLQTSTLGQNHWSDATSGPSTRVSMQLLQKHCIPAGLRTTARDVLSIRLSRKRRKSVVIVPIRSKRHCKDKDNGKLPCSKRATGTARTPYITVWNRNRSPQWMMTA